MTNGESKRDKAFGPIEQRANRGDKNKSVQCRVSGCKWQGRKKHYDKHMQTKHPEVKTHV